MLSISNSSQVHLHSSNIVVTRKLSLCITPLISWLVITHGALWLQNLLWFMLNTPLIIVITRLKGNVLKCRFSFVIQFKPFPSISRTRTEHTATYIETRGTTTQLGWEINNTRNPTLIWRGNWRRIFSPKLLRWYVAKWMNSSFVNDMWKKIVV